MATIAGSKLNSSARVVHPGAVQSDAWTTIHADAEAAAETTALTRPTLAGVNAGVRYLQVPDGAVRVQVRVRYDGTVTTSPVLRVFGLTGAIPTTGVVAEGTGVAWAKRLDSIANSTGTTLTLDATNDITDGTYKWSPVMENQIDGSPWVDLQGSSYVTVLVETAANVSGAALIEAVFLN